MTQVKENKSKVMTITCHEQFENSSRLGVPKDRDPDPHICIMQSDRLVSKYVMSAGLQFVYISKRTFSSNSSLLEFSFPSNSSFSILPTGKQTMCKLSGKEVE